jgi:hypothetical protein
MPNHKLTLGRRSRSIRYAGVPDQTLPMRKVASLHTETMNYWDSMWNIGYTGYVHYRNRATPTAWNHGIMPALAAAYGDQPLELQLTCKNHSDSGLQTVLNNLPDAWLPYFKYNHYQEPEDDLTSSAQQAAYRATYTAAADVIRADGDRVSLPWLELAEYSLELLYVNGNATRSPALFTPPDADYAGVLWSFFEYGERGNNVLDAMVARVVRAMDEFFPGKPWGLMASAYTLEPLAGPFSAAQKAAQASWLTESYYRLRDAGCTEWAWYNVAFGGAGGPAGEGRVEVIPETLAAFQALP